MAPAVKAKKKRRPRAGKKRVLVIMHESLVPPESLEDYTVEEVQEFRTEDDVIEGLKELGHEVRPLGLSDELGPLWRAIEEFRPHVVFNLLEEFRGHTAFDYHVVGYLELNGVAYTGCNPRGLLLARDKALSKKILAYHRIRTPRFATFLRGRKVQRPRELDFPLIVKSLVEESSFGIAQASVVESDEALVERVQFIHERIRTDAIAEQFISGRELYSGVIGNFRLTVLPTWELYLEGMPDEAHRIATRKVKWDLAYQKKHGIDHGAAKLDDVLERRIAETARRVCRRLHIDGYARVDFRLGDDGELYFLEANPNPDIADGEEFSSAAAASGLAYRELLQRLVNLGIRRAAL
jgi:D-alanine-D-alanine ligase